MKEYSSVYKAQYDHYKPSQSHLKKPSKQAQTLQNKLIEKHKNNFTDKLGKHDISKIKPSSLHVDNEKLALHKPTAHIKPYDAPFHL